jgi:hypothetical protein
MLGNCPSLDSGLTKEIQVQAKEQHQDSGETIHEEKITKAKIDP